VTEERRELEVGIEALGLSASPAQVDSLLAYLEELDRTNQSFNLTRIPRGDFVRLHLLDSLMALTVLPNAVDPTVIDVGTGAGFPGVPLATLMPKSRVTLLDSTAKKVRFAAETARACGVSNVSGIHGRAEMLAHTPEHREAYDVVTSRAVAAYPTVIEWMLPLVKVGGVAVALKGSGYEDEMVGSERLLQDLGGGAPQVHECALPGSNIVRYLIVIPKVRETKPALPR
jgi:16S rRNA (guanine527-N7)-methyltransferase